MDWLQDDGVLFFIAVICGALGPAMLWVVYSVTPWGRAEARERERREAEEEIERILAECETPSRFPYTHIKE